MKITTLYIFYLNDKNDNRALEPTLYAYTDKEVLFERFLETRKKSKFSYVTRELTKDQLMMFKSQYSQQQLSVAKFKTKNEAYPTYVSNVELVCTWGEEQTVILASDRDFYEEFRKVMFNPIVFNKKIQVCLYKLGFFSIYQWLYNMMYISDPLDYPEYSGIFNMEGNLCELPSTISSNVPDIVIDQFQIFMHLYGGTMK